MIHGFARLVMIALLWSEAAALPVGVLLREKKQGDCCGARLEVVGAGEAYYYENRNPVAAKVEEIAGLLHVVVAGETRWVLTPKDGAWTDQENRRWVTRESVVKTDPAWTVVKIKVTDQHGKSPDEFGIRYRIQSKDGDWDPLLVRPLQGKLGMTEIHAPGQCRIHLSIEHPDFVRGYNASQELERTNGEPELKVEFERGRTVRGRVLDDSTGTALAGAKVCPLIFTPPLFTGDDERAVETGADGSFELRGVDGSLAVEHSDFLKEEIYLEEEDAEEVIEVRLKKGRTIEGLVRDPSGKPLADVMVNDGSGKRTVTDGSGRFALKGLRKWNDKRWSISFSKEGYNDHDFRGTEVAPDGLNVELIPLPELRGRVVFADGRPVGKFRIVCGPGANPSGYQCETIDVDGTDGRFAIRPESLPEEGSDFWLGGGTEGAAPWEAVVPQAVLESGDFRIELQPGASLSATLALPEGVREFAASLVPVDREPKESYISSDHPGKVLATRTLRQKKGDRVHIPHLRAGEYELRIVAKGGTPMRLPVKIGSADVDLGDLRLDGSGSIAGIVNDPYAKGKAWRFADGEIHVEGFGEDEHKPFMTFKTDETGRFRVDGVPTGKVTVVFPYPVTADIIDGLVRQALVLENQVTELRFEGEDGAWSQPLRLLFDGKEAVPAYNGIRKVDNVTDRKPMFRLDVLGEGKDPIMTSVEWSADGKSMPVIPDLPPGRWKIRAYDWLGSRGFDEGLRAETMAEVGEKRQPVTLELGGRALSGRVTSARETKRLVRLVAVGKAGGRVFFSRGDDEGNFVIRYLPEDDYTVHAHDDDGGWCDLGSKRLDRAVVDMGDHALGDGGHVHGKIDRIILAANRDFRLSAHGPDGLAIPVDEVENDGSYRFGHLRPGKWTILAHAGDQEIKRGTVDVKKGETVEAEPFE